MSPLLANAEYAFTRKTVNGTKVLLRFAHTRIIIAGMTEKELQEELRQRVTGQTLKHTARELGVSVSYLHDIIKKRRKPGRKILKAMGLERRVELVRQ